MTAYTLRHDIPIGGFVAMGVDLDERFLFVITHSGRGVFDIATAERVTRDYAVVYPTHGEVPGIGPFAGHAVSVAEYDFANALVLVSPSGRYKFVGESTGIRVYEST